MKSFIKKIAVNTALIAVFCLLIFVVIWPLLAERSFLTAEKLAKEYKWAQADGEFRKAVRIDPFNSKYQAGFGNFLVMQAKYQGNKGPLLDEAGKLFMRASELDPRNAEIYLDLGMLELNRKSIGRAFNYFRRAAANDPNGFNIAYSIGLAGLKVWKNIGGPDRAFVSDRLRLTVLARPYYAGDIYLKVWEARKDFSFLRSMTPGTLEGQRGLYNFIVSYNLWQFRKELANSTDDYGAIAEQQNRIKREIQKYKNPADPTENILSEDWLYEEKGRLIRFSGPIYGNMTIYAPINVGKGSATLEIKLKKLLVIKADNPDDPKYSPYAIIRLNDKVIGETFVANDDWKSYEFGFTGDTGDGVLSVSFVNDVYDTAKGNDRNLIVGDAKIYYGQDTISGRRE